MAGRRAPHMRARDADRNATCQILDAALVEGQLSGEEHRQRVAAATRAATLGELQGLVTDLQPTAHGTPPRRAGRPTRHRLMAAVGIAGALAVVIAVLVATAGPDNPPTPNAPAAHPAVESPIAPVVPASPGAAPDEVEPSVVTMPEEFHTVEGMTALLDTIRQRFGSTTGIELAIWRTEAMLLLPDPLDPNEKQLYRFNDGWGTPSNRDRDPEDLPVDLGAFDVPAVVEALRNAPATVGIPPGDVSDLVVDIDDVQEPPGAASLELMVKVSSTSGADGFIYLDSAGTVKRVEQPT